MFKKLSIKAQLFMLAGFMSLLMCIIGIMGLINLGKSNNSLREVYEMRVIPIKRLKIIADAYAIGMGDSLNKVINKIILPSEGLNDIERASSTIALEWAQYHQGNVLDSEESAEMAHLNGLMNKADEAIKELRVILESKDTTRLSDFMAKSFYPILEPISTSVSKLINFQLVAVKEEYEEATEEYYFLRQVAIWTNILGIFMGFFTCWWIYHSISQALNEVSSQLGSIVSGQADLTKRITVLRTDEVGDVSNTFNRFMGNLQALVKRVQKSGIQVTSSATAIASTSKQLERTITEFASFTNEVGATAKEISATSQELVKTMSELSSVATNTANLATTGQSDLGRMETTMSQMEDASAQISSRLAIISEKAANITTVVTTITKIADQTNLLSLNASIEAEKAGEYGLGFAVVAREIRRLADQVALATLDIEQMVKEMKSAVSAGVMEMDKFSDEVRRDVQDVRNIGSQLAQIIDQVQALLPRFETVHEGVQAQSEGARQISDSMVQLSEAVRQTGHSLAESSLVVTALNQSAKELQKEVSGFKVDNLDIVNK